MSDYGREVIQLVEIDQNQCSRIYGDGVGTSPSTGCQAQLGTTGAHKCFNTLASCQDSANYLAGTLTLRFGPAQRDLARYYDNVIPALQSIRTSPGSINLAGMDRNQGAFGQRESVTIVFDDLLHSDLQVDKYRLERATGAAQSDSVGYDPHGQGTFWGKWLARNPYFSAYALRVYDGFLGDAIASMRVRNYVMDSVTGPNNGKASVVAKDLFSRVESRKAMAPAPSDGYLQAAITSSDTSATLLPAGIGNSEYPASGHARIGDEVVSFTRSGDVLTLTRAQLNTTADSHDGEDAVQLVLEYSAELAVDIVYDLLINYTMVDPATIDKTAWDTAAATITNLYTAYITEPTAVKDLIGELEEQGGFTLWPDVTTGTITFKALQSLSPAFTVDDDAWIVAGSLKTKRLVNSRVSEVWMYYGQVDPTKSLDERTNFRSRYVNADLSAETNYGAAAIREIFSRWIPQFGRLSAQAAAVRILEMFVNPPMEADFRVPASKSSLLDLNTFFSLETADVQDETGTVASTTHAIVELERDESEISVRSQEIHVTTQDPTAPRVIYLESNAFNIALRTVHDSLYPAPTGIEDVTFVIEAGVDLGSTSTGSPAVRTGTWNGVVPKIINHGRIQGKAGAGGHGCDDQGHSSAGGDGGDAILAEDYIDIDNTDGEIWGGGGGGGGGQWGWVSLPGGEGATYEGGGGGASAGYDVASGGAPGSGTVLTYHLTGGYGSAGTKDAAGAGGAGGNDGTRAAGNGGAGGGPGIDGSSGAGVTGGGWTGTVGPTAGGTRGHYLSGNSFVTWTATGDVRGRVA